jgi:predicted Rdx family selenoprotein
LIRGGGGDFIVVADGRELWNKRRMGDEFPEPNAILEKLRAGG